MSWRIRKAVSILCISAAGMAMNASASVSETTQLNLEESIRIAISNATSVLKTENDVKVNGTQLIQSYAQFLPDLRVGGNYSYTWGKSLLTFSGASLLDTRYRGAGYSISSSLNLFNGFSDYAGLKASLARNDASILNLQWAKQQVALDITQSYLQVVLDMELLDIARKNLAESQARLKLLKGQTRVGSASIADLYRQEAQTSADELTTTSTENRLHDDQIILVRKLRLDLTRQYAFEVPSLRSEAPKLGGRPIEDLIQEAFRQRADLKSTTLQTQATDWDITRSRSGYFPKLNLDFDRTAEGRYLQRQFVDGVDVLPSSQQSLIPQLGNQVTYAVVLNLSWNLFDRFQTRLSAARSDAAHENAKIDLADNQLQIESDVRLAVSDLQVALRQIETARVGVEAADKAYAAVKGRYEVGAATFIDLLAAQAALVQARSSQAQAQINIKLRETALEYATGLLRIY